MPTTATMQTMSKSKVYICTTAQETDLADGTAYAALTWVQIKGIGRMTEIGVKQNVLTYDTWDKTVAQKRKGLINAGDPELEVARDPNDAGQDALRTAAATTANYAFKIAREDGTIFYNRGIVTGPVRPQGRNEDFDVEVFTLGFNQQEIIVEVP